LLSWTSNYQHVEELVVQQIFLNILSGPYPHNTHLGPILIIPFHLHLGSLQRTHTWSFQATVTKRFFIFFHVWVKTHLLILLITVTVKYKNLNRFLQQCTQHPDLQIHTTQHFVIHALNLCPFHRTGFEVIYSFYQPFTVVMKCVLCSNKVHVLAF
jgi:hypothetical protein